MVIIEHWCIVTVQGHGSLMQCRSNRCPSVVVSIAVFPMPRLCVSVLLIYSDSVRVCTHAGTHRGRRFLPMCLCFHCEGGKDRILPRSLLRCGEQARFRGERHVETFIRSSFYLKEYMMWKSMKGCKGKVHQRKICMDFNQQSYAVTSRVEAEQSKSEAPLRRLKIYPFWMRANYDLLHTLRCC